LLFFAAKENKGLAIKKLSSVFIEKDCKIVLKVLKVHNQHSEMVIFVSD